MPKMTRRELLKLSGMAAGSLALGSTISGCASDSTALAGGDPTQMNSLLASLPPYYPGTEKLGPDEMRITFLGTTCIPMVSQAAVSVFVELGNGDSVCFDMGTGSIIKYWAMGINMDKMSKIFVAHLHADHMGDLPFVYGFGPSYGRLWPLYVWGPGNSGFVYTSPDKKQTRGPFNDGTAAYCAAVQTMMCWHNESQSFLNTSYPGYTIPAFDPQGHRDAYDLVPFELDWWKTGMDTKGNPTYDNIAYNQGGVKITHFPAVHTREGAISYKLEYNGMSMIYSGDTKPSQYVIDQAKSGLDVLIHEIVMPADIWVAKQGIDTAKYPGAVTEAQKIQDSSHTPQKAFGYILDQIKQQKGQLPKLAVGTHFQATDDTIRSALTDIRKWYPASEGAVTIASDTMVINVAKGKAPVVRRGIVSNYAWPQTNMTEIQALGAPSTPKYWTYDPSTGLPTGDPSAQLDKTAPIIDPSLYNAK